MNLVKSITFAVIFYIFSTTASATTISFSGVIQDGLWSAINDPDDVLGFVPGFTATVGDTFSGSYTLGNSLFQAPQTNPNGGTLHYPSGAELDVNIGANPTLSVGAGSFAYVLIGNDESFSGDPVLSDAWLVGTVIGAGVSSVDNQFYFTVMELLFFDETLTRLSNEDYFVNTSSEGWSDDISFNIRQMDVNGLFVREVLNGIVTQVGTISNAPEPTTLTLLGLGIFGLSLRKSKRLH